MKYAYYPGCSAESSARDQHVSSLAVAHALGIEFQEIKGWSCCGSTPAHQTDRVLAASLSAANLVLAKKMGLDVVVNCAACYNRLKVANYEVLRSKEMREKIEQTIGSEYDGSVNVRHLMEILLEDFGLEKLKNTFTHSLNGLKVAAYYGCLLVRPQEVTNFDDPENPQSIDKLIASMGGESLDWPHKVECCGNSLSLTTQSNMVVDFSDKIIQMAKAAGAQCIAVACPLCQVNLDLRQNDIHSKTGNKHNMPILYITQLLGLCLGLSEKSLGMEKLIVSPASIVNAIESSAAKPAEKSV